MYDVSSPAAPPAVSLWRRWWWLVRWGGTCLGLAYVAHLIDLHSVRLAIRMVAPSSVITATALIAFGILAGVVRWLLLLRAYGASTLPTFGAATRIYFIAVFYNTFIPGGVVGDVMRGVMSRKSFGEHGAPAALTVVFVERAMGLAGVFVVAAVGLMTAGRALPEAETLWWWSAGGIALAAGGILGVGLGRRLGKLPAPFGPLAARLPAVVQPAAFSLAALLSLVTQLMTALAGWVLLRDLHAGASLTAALLVVPLSSATAFLPITVGGAGAREAVFISLCAAVLGLASDAALAAALLLWFVILMNAAAGGLLQLRQRSLDQGEL